MGFPRQSLWRVGLVNVSGTLGGLCGNNNEKGRRRNQESLCCRCFRFHVSPTSHLVWFHYLVIQHLNNLTFWRDIISNWNTYCLVLGLNPSLGDSLSQNSLGPFRFIYVKRPSDKLNVRILFKKLKFILFPLLSLKVVSIFSMISLGVVKNPLKKDSRGQPSVFRSAIQCFKKIDDIKRHVAAVNQQIETTVADENQQSATQKRRRQYLQTDRLAKCTLFPDQQLKRWWKKNAISKIFSEQFRVVRLNSIF